jgi:ribonucleotide reductase alpha subunit
MQNIMVSNASGDLISLDILKIRKKTLYATKHLTEVNPVAIAMELESSLAIQFYTGMPTSAIQDNIIKTAIDKIDIDVPFWTFVAAAAFLDKQYHSVGRLFHAPKGAPYSHTLKEYLEYGVAEGRINDSFYRSYDLDELNAYIKPERDFNFNYLGLKSAYDRYFLKNRNGDCFELPQHMFMGIAMYLAQNEKPEDKHMWAKTFYDLISTFEVMLATPTLSNARTNRNQMSSCYQGSTPDNIEGIFDGYRSMSLLSKFGGGIGWDWTPVRSGGSSIDNNKNVGGGTIPFLKITNDIAIAVDQLGTRKGAIAVYLEPWHMDINDFLDLKKNSGEERRRAHDIFPALWIPDLFMQRAEDDGIWTLFDPYETPDLHEAYGEEFERLYCEYEVNDDIKKETVSAKELWKKIILQYFETGVPFLTFKDEANRRNSNSHDGTILASNLCVTGDTRLATQFGLKKAKDLFDMNQKLVATYDKRTNGDSDDFGVDLAECIEMHKTSLNAEVFEVVTESGYSIKSTNWHEYYVVEGSDVIKKPLSAMEIGDILMIQSGVGQFTETGSYNDGATLAINALKEGSVPEAIFAMSIDATVGFIHTIMSNVKMKAKVENCNLQSVSLSVELPNEDFTKDMQIIISNFGVKSRIFGLNLDIKDQYALRYIKKIGLVSTETKELSEIIMKLDIENILDHDNGFICKERIVSITAVGNEDVYDTTQIVNHSLIFNGIVTGNCTEIFQNTSPNKYGVYIEFKDGTMIIADEKSIIDVKLSDGVMSSKIAKKISSVDIVVLDGEEKYVQFVKQTIIKDGEILVCNLASVNLSKVNTPSDFQRIMPGSIRMLDNVIDLNMYPVEQAMKTNLRSRAIGLGVMGEAQMLAENEIMFGSQEHFEKIDEIMESFSFNAINASADLAIERGSYPSFEGSKWSKGILPIHTANKKAVMLTEREAAYDWDNLRNKIVATGIRNGYLMAIAPTSTISIVTGTTQAIEPIYRLKYSEENLSGLIKVTAPNLNVNTIGYYPIAYNLDQTILVKAAAIRQKWLDQGQSLNIFIRTDKANGKYLNDIYMLAWKLGLKSTYYLRSESPEEIVTPDDEVTMDRAMECSGCQ